MERRLRLVTGLTLFAYATCHFMSHATGLFRLAAMDQVGRMILLAPWRTLPGRLALFTALGVHAGLGLRALYRRRHLRIPAAEAWQLALGLSIPLLLIPHATNVRLGSAVFGLDDSYYRILYQYWVTPPLTGLARQLALLFAVWVHGCVGLHFWLRPRRWYAGWRPVLLTGAVLLPFLAVLGLMNAGWDTDKTAALDAGFARAHGPPRPGSAQAAAIATLHALWWALQLAWVALVGLILALRLARNMRAQNRTAVRITYPDGRVVAVPRGFSVLEASRWEHIPHASVCGGRGRCSTCRVRIVRGLEDLPAPGASEQATLRRVGAPPGVRLGCQLRPTRDVSVVPLLAPEQTTAAPMMTGGDVRELLVTAMFVDLRESTRLAAGRLPFDALFLIERYVQRVSAAVQAHGGQVTSVAGDGVMSVFGARRGSAGQAAGAALGAAADLWDSLQRLSDELLHEIGAPLGFGIGLHSGLSAVGSIVVSGRPALHFLGDTGNVAARLEAATKELGGVMIVSDAVLTLAGRPFQADSCRAELRIRGRDKLEDGGDICQVVILRDLAEARRLLAGAEAAPVRDVVFATSPDLAGG